MAYIDDLKDRRDTVAAEIKALATTTAGGLPNASGQGSNVDHVGYKKSLYDELKMLDEVIATEEGGWEIASEGY